MRPLETFIEQRKERFVRNSLMSDEFLDFVNKNMKPIEKQMSYYQCAIMEVETKFKVLNEQYSLEYDRNPIEDIKSRVKSMESLIKKIRKKDIPLTLSSIEEISMILPASVSSALFQMISTCLRTVCFLRMTSHFLRRKTISKIQNRADTAASSDCQCTNFFTGRKT